MEAEPIDPDSGRSDPTAQPVPARRTPRQRVVLRVLVVLLLVLAAVSAVVCGRLHQWPWQAGPDRIHVCGRDFLGPGYHYTLEQVRVDGNAPVARVTTLRGGRVVWGRHINYGNVPGCGTGVYLRTSANDFRGYDLSGGP